MTQALSSPLCPPPSPAAPAVLHRLRRPEPQPAVVVVRDRLIGAAITALLGICTTGVVYIARTVPLKFVELEQHNLRQDATNDRQDNTVERQITILERHEQRLDNAETRLTRLEQHK